MRCGSPDFGWRGPCCPELNISCGLCFQGFLVTVRKGPWLAAPWAWSSCWAIELWLVCHNLKPLEIKPKAENLEFLVTGTPPTKISYTIPHSNPKFDISTWFFLWTIPLQCIEKFKFLKGQFPLILFWWQQKWCWKKIQVAWTYGEPNAEV